MLKYWELYHDRGVDAENFLFRLLGYVQSFSYISGIFALNQQGAAPP